MVKEMHCGDLMPGCSFVATGTTDDEVMKKATQHAKDKHKIKEMTPDLTQKVKAAIKTRA